MRIVWTKPSSRDLTAIASYIGQHNEPAAVRTVNRIEAAVERLANHPFLGRPGRRGNTRELVVSGVPYTVVYRLTETIDILAVFHQAREWPLEF